MWARAVIPVAVVNACLSTWFHDSKLPITRGAIESAIRRVENLRLKGASISCHNRNAEAILFLRSYSKAGRWNHLERQELTATTGITAWA